VSHSAKEGAYSNFYKVFDLKYRYILKVKYIRGVGQASGRIIESQPREHATWQHDSASGAPICGPYEVLERGLQ
jgi:hypothetical protein